MEMLGWELTVAHSWIATHCVHVIALPLITTSFAVKVVPMFWHKCGSCCCVFIPHFGQEHVSSHVYHCYRVYGQWYINVVNFMHLLLFFRYMQRYANFVKLCTCSKFPSYTSKTQCDLSCFSYYISIFLLSPSRLFWQVLWETVVF